jgi:aminoglycoside phosphotransferase (APT) family kinase protein
MGELLGHLHDLEPEDALITSAALAHLDGETYAEQARGLCAWAREGGGLSQLEVRRLAGLLARLPPFAGRSLCHGDYHAVQCIVAGQQIAAVVDWEGSNIGDPLVDLALAQVYLEFYAPAQFRAAFLRGYLGVRPVPPGKLGRYGIVRIFQILALLRAWSSRGNPVAAERCRQMLRHHLEELRSASSRT